METSPRTSLWEPFATLTDPRRDHLKEHRLIEILTVTHCAVICGADDWMAVAPFGETAAGKRRVWDWRWYRVMLLATWDAEGLASDLECSWGRVYRWARLHGARGLAGLDERRRDGR